MGPLILTTLLSLFVLSMVTGCSDDGGETARPSSDAEDDASTDAAEDEGGADAGADTSQDAVIDVGEEGDVPTDAEVDAPTDTGDAGDAGNAGDAGEDASPDVVEEPIPDPAYPCRRDFDLDGDGVVEERGWHLFLLGGLEATRKRDTGADGTLDDAIFWTRDASGNELSRERDRGVDGVLEERRERRWDASNRLLEESLDQGADGAVERRIRYTYDPASGRLASVWWDEGDDGTPDYAWTATFTPGGLVLTSEVDGLVELGEIVVQADGLPDVRIAGELTGTTHRLTRDFGADGTIDEVFVTTLDAQERPLRTERDGILSTDGAVRDPADGELDAIYTWTWDEAGRLLSFEADAPVGGSTELRERYTYEGDRLVMERFDGLLDGVDDIARRANGVDDQVVTYMWDEAGRLLERLDQFEVSAGRDRVRQRQVWGEAGLERWALDLDDDGAEEIVQRWTRDPEGRDLRWQMDGMIEEIVPYSAAEAFVTPRFDPTQTLQRLTQTRPVDEVVDAQVDLFYGCEIP